VVTNSTSNHPNVRGADARLRDHPGRPEFCWLVAVILVSSFIAVPVIAG
jgi:hypothetical protein